MRRLAKRARKAASLLKALAHENRLLILCALAEQERSVTELEALLSSNQSTVSQQLARLRYDGLVDTRRDWRTVYYSLADDRTRQLVDAVCNFCHEEADR
jgi:DNA-binding transcriptional ArsR family regulator